MTGLCEEEDEDGTSVEVRFPRDLPDSLDIEGTWRDKFWWPEKQVGTSWFAGDLGSKILSFTGFDNERLADVEKLAWIFLIQLVLCCFAYVVACAGLICDTGDGESKRKSSMGSLGTYFWGLCSGVLGFCAVKYDCKEMLWTTVILSMIILICAVITLILMLIGLCKMCCDSEGLGHALASLCYFIIGVVFVILYAAFNILIVWYAWPFLTGNTLEDQLDN